MFLGAIADDEAALEAAMRKALEASDMLVLSGGTSKGAGDVSHRIIARLGKPGIIAHGVALKPGKPLCLAVCDGKPVVILPGFPTSAMFTFHDMIVPVLRRMAGLPPRSDAKVSAKVPVRIASELGRTEFVMVSLVEGADGLIAYPTGKGSGAITSFAQADGFLRIDALADQMPAGSQAEVTLFTPHVRVPDLVIVGSHCTGLDLVTAPLARAGLSVRSIAVGSLGGLGGGQARRMRFRADPSVRREQRDLQHALSRRRARTGAGLAADAGHRVPQGRHALRRLERARTRCAPRSPIPPASWSTATRAPARAS